MLAALLVLCASLYAQAGISDTIPLKFDTLTQSLPIPATWKYHPGDNAAYALPGFDDSAWDSLETDFSMGDTGYGKFPGIGWFRLNVRIDSSLINKPLAMLLRQNGASEIYIDGELLNKFGTINTSDTAAEIRYNPQDEPYILRFKDSTRHTIAVRYAHHNARLLHDKYQESSAGFVVKIEEVNEAVNSSVSQAIGSTVLFISFFIICTTLSFLHFLLFLFNRKQRSNLFYSLFVGGFGFVFLWVLIRIAHPNPDFTTKLTHHMTFVHVLYVVALAALIYSLYYKKFPAIFWIISGLGALLVVMHFVNVVDGTYIGIGWMVLLAVVAVEIVRVVILSIMHKRDGAWILGTGLIAFVAFFVIITVVGLTGGSMNFNDGSASDAILGLLTIYGSLSIPISMSIYLARNFAQTNRNLEIQLKQVEDLSAKTLQQEQEKQQILSSQKEQLEVQVKERTAELAQKNKDITDSINYAQRIQQAILPPIETIKKTLPDSFIYYRPKDIVSGDFYFFERAANLVFIAAADCTGHGVPGAFMSMIGHDQLHQIINDKKIIVPGEILSHLNSAIKNTLKQDNEHSQTRDGMDIGLCCIDIDNRKLQYAGAMRPLYRVSHELEEVKADKVAIGGTTPEGYIFKNNELALRPGETLYMFSDGYADQFGGELGKKFMSRNFKQLLLSIYNKPMHEQERILHEAIEAWRGDYEQVDDILVIGIRISDHN